MTPRTVQCRVLTPPHVGEALAAGGWRALDWRLWCDPDDDRPVVWPVAYATMQRRQRADARNGSAA